MAAPDLLSYSMVIVTGAGGWLGSRLVAALTEGTLGEGFRLPRGCRLRCLCMAGEPTRDLQARGAEIVVGDLRDDETIAALADEAAGALVIHLAGVIHPQRSTREFEAVNHQATKALYAAMNRAGATRVVAMSSNSPMGANPHPEHVFDETSPYRPYMGYGKSKMRMEQALRTAMEQPEATPVTLIRAPWFYGPGQPPRQTQFFAMCRDGKFPIMGDGSNRRSKSFVDSLASGILLAAGTARAAGETYWLADERPYPMHEIVDTVRTVLQEDFGMQLSRKNLHVPSVVADMARAADWLIQQVGAYHQKVHVLSEMNLTIACDISKARCELGYQPLVELREGMRLSVAWCLDNGQTF